MMTLLNVLPNGHEDLIPVRRVSVYQPTADPQTSEDVAAVFGEIENGTVFPFKEGTVYVMNDSGATVATYHLRYPEPSAKVRVSEHFFPPPPPNVVDGKV